MDEEEKTALSKVAKAGTLVEMMAIAIAVGDIKNFSAYHKEAGQLLFDALLLMEEKDVPCPECGDKDCF